MVTVSRASSPLIQFHKNYLSLNGSTFPFFSHSHMELLLPKSVLSLPLLRAVESEAKTFMAPICLKGRRKEVDGEQREGEKGVPKRVDCEDQNLDETVPLVGLVRMILHSGRYKSGKKLDPEHQKTIMEKLLPYHPSYETKRGCGIDYNITVGATVDYHPDYEGTRCLFIVRTDGEMVIFHTGNA